MFGELYEEFARIVEIAMENNLPEEIVRNMMFNAIRLWELAQLEASGKIMKDENLDGKIAEIKDMIRSFKEELTITTSCSNTYKINKSYNL